MNINVNTEHIYDKYIYLDWNVFKYMKNNREDKMDLDKEFFEAVLKLKKKYRFVLHPKSWTQDWRCSFYE